MFSLSDTPKLYFVSFAFLCLGGLLLLIGFATPHWYEAVVYFGLWRVCGYSTITGGIVCGPATALVDWFRATQALSCLALMSVAGSGLAALAFIPMKNHQKPMAMITAILSMGAAGCNGVAVLIFGIFTGSFFGYSFFLAALATVILAVASILSFVLACNLRRANALPS